MKIGILALQGAVEPHKIKLGTEITAVEVRHADQLEGLSGIILPGGESSAMLRLLHVNQLWKPLRDFVSRKPTWGVCAGAILLAKKVENPAQESLERIDIEVERNAFGRQANSFIDRLSPTPWWKHGPAGDGIFIRAPRIRSVQPQVQVLFTWGSEPVMVEQDHILVSTFHPELSDSNLLHGYFVQKCRG